MDDREKKSVVKMLSFLGVGYVIGIVLKKILIFAFSFLKANAAFDLLIAFIVPIIMVISLFVFLYIYNKDKNDVIE